MVHTHIIPLRVHVCLAAAAVDDAADADAVARCFLLLELCWLAGAMLPSMTCYMHAWFCCILACSELCVCVCVCFVVLATLLL